ncbi:MAG: Na-translocating system protein MpsC family protein [Pleurocapsa sp. MO_192.B19]|nr:Na-translocating system protein MpsC family protein [Pleurocapsa sp. MO_192.B19]
MFQQNVGNDPYYVEKAYIIDNKVAIAIENPITPVERLLDKSKDSEFVRDLRDRIDAIVKTELLLGMERTLQVKIVDLTINTTLDNNFTGIVALLYEVPKVRIPQHTSIRISLI